MLSSKTDNRWNELTKIQNKIGISELPHNSKNEWNPEIRSDCCESKNKCVEDCSLPGFKHIQARTEAILEIPMIQIVREILKFFFIYQFQVPVI